jgi:hypothetical protein
LSRDWTPEQEKRVRRRLDGWRWFARAAMADAVGLVLLVLVLGVSAVEVLNR